MALDISKTYLYHITDLSNLPAIVKAGGLLSDAKLVGGGHQVIGYSNIKTRRMTEIQVPCCGNRYVGEFVPFYFCPRSPMLFTVNRGNTGRPVGCQQDIVHLVTTIEISVGLANAWAFSNGNAGAYHADFFDDLAQLASLEWEIIRSNDWGGDIRRHAKASEFLVCDFFPWDAIFAIGCRNEAAAERVATTLAGVLHIPKILVKPGWYY